MGTKRAIDELAYAFFAQVMPAAYLDGTAEYTAGAGLTTIGGAATYGNSVGAVNVLVVPSAAAAVIVSIAAASLPAGLYNIDVIAGFGATPEGTTDFNMQLVVGGTNAGSPPLNSGGTAVSKLMVSGANDRRTFQFKRTLTGSQDLAITTTTAGGSAGSVYLAQIIATKQGS